jgi:hypothetical protein
LLVLIASHTLWSLHVVAQAVQSRLDALEADNEGAEDALAAGSDDDEFVIAGQDDEEEEEGRAGLVLCDVLHPRCHSQ